jgi:hypothetical protein
VVRHDERTEHALDRKRHSLATRTPKQQTRRHGTDGAVEDEYVAEPADIRREQEPAHDDEDGAERSVLHVIAEVEREDIH